MSLIARRLADTSRTSLPPRHPHRNAFIKSRLLSKTGDTWDSPDYAAQPHTHPNKMRPLGCFEVLPPYGAKKRKTGRKLPAHVWGWWGVNCKGKPAYFSHFKIEEDETRVNCTWAACDVCYGTPNASKCDGNGCITTLTNRECFTTLRNGRRIDYQNVPILSIPHLGDHIFAHDDAVYTHHSVTPPSSPLTSISSTSQRKSPPSRRRSARRAGIPAPKIGYTQLSGGDGWTQRQDDEWEDMDAAPLEKAFVVPWLKDLARDKHKEMMGIPLEDETMYEDGDEDEGLYAKPPPAPSPPTSDIELESVISVASTEDGNDWVRMAQSFGAFKAKVPLRKEPVELVTQLSPIFGIKDGNNVGRQINFPPSFKTHVDKGAASVATASNHTINLHLHGPSSGSYIQPEMSHSPSSFQHSAQDILARLDISHPPAASFIRDITADHAALSRAYDLALKDRRRDLRLVGEDVGQVLRVNTVLSRGLVRAVKVLKLAAKWSLGEGGDSGSSGGESQEEIELATFREQKYDGRAESPAPSHVEEDPKELQIMAAIDKENDAPGDLDFAYA